MPPIVGIVTRTKDRNVLLKRAIESVLAQTYTDWIQVIVNDGGKPEEVEQLLERYRAAAEDRIRLIHHDTSRGMEAASNAGIRAIIDEVDYLIIHDDDDSWAPDYLRIATSELTAVRTSSPQIYGVITQANCVYEEIQGARVTISDVEPFLPWVNQGLISFDAMLHQCQFAPIQFLYDKSAISKIGFYREDLPVLGDWEFNLRFLKEYDIAIIPQYLAFYHHRRSAHGHYTNSVIGAKDVHHLHRQRLKNEWLRADLRGGLIGLGTLANQREVIEQLIQQNDRILERLEFLESRRSASGGVLTTMSLLGSSGRPVHYIRRFVHFLRQNGLRAALARVRFWVDIKSGRLPS